MEILDTPGAMSVWSRRHREVRIGFVPTMGALHGGHLSLVDIARRHCDVVVVSIFVNPLQFDRDDDLAGYPRPVESDLRLCRDAGVDAVYAPTPDAMYRPGFQTFVEPGMLAHPLEGAGRPGHFRGVATVVAKLFNAVRPDVAVFGQKDYQQLAVIRRMARDLDTGVDIVAGPTLREDDGLAMSSRNRRLTPEQRAAAVVVPAALRSIESSVKAGARDVPTLLRHGLEVLGSQPLARVEYLSIDDAAELTPLEVVDRSAVVSTAVWFGDVRLIDNVVIDV